MTRYFLGWQVAAAPKVDEKGGPIILGVNQSDVPGAHLRFETRKNSICRKTKGNGLIQNLFWRNVIKVATRNFEKSI